MKFPLPVDTFPAVTISDEDTDALKGLAETLVNDAMVQYHEHRYVQHNKIDPQRYKFVKTKGDFKAYENKLVSLAAARGTPNSYTKPAQTSRKMHSVLAVGTIRGNLDDLMYGLIHPTSELQRLKGSYTNDKIQDARVLATLLQPTTENPVCGLFLKWAVSEFAPFMLRGVVRPRDFVFLEANGVHISPENNERVGYFLMHSIDIPGIRDLHAEYKIVRGQLSICGVFRQIYPNVLELFMEGFVDSMGDISPSVAVMGTTEALLSFGVAIHCAQMKKLNWTLSKSKPPAHDQYPLTPPPVCIGCHKDLSGSLRGKHCCRICHARVCSKCRLVQKLSFLSPSTRRIIVKPMSFCGACVRASMQTNALEVAREELVCENGCYGAFEWTSNIYDSPVSITTTRSTSFDSMFGAWEIPSTGRD